MSVRLHSTTFLVEHAVESVTEMGCRAVVDAMNPTWAETNRRFEFAGLRRVEALPYFPGSPDIVPSGSFPHEVWIRKGDSLGQGCVGTGAQGEGIARLTSPRLFGPYDGWEFKRLVHIVDHECGHVNGLGRGDWVYKSWVIEDGSPIPPRLRLNGFDPMDEFWRTHADLLSDPMFTPTNNPKWSELHRRILQGEYRMARRVVEVPLDLFVDVRDTDTSEPVAASVTIFDCDTDTEDWSVVDSRDGSAYTFRRWPNDSVQSSRTATLIKAFAPGYKPRAFWHSIGDAEMDVMNGHAPTIRIRMERASKAVRVPGLGSVRDGEIVAANLVSGETYTLWQFIDNAPKPIHSFTATFEREQLIREDFIGAGFYSLQHLPGVIAPTASTLVAPQSLRRGPEMLCEFCMVQRPRFSGV